MGNLFCLVWMIAVRRNRSRSSSDVEENEGERKDCRVRSRNITR